MESDLEKISQSVWCRTWETRGEMRWFRVDVSEQRETQEDGEVLLTPQSINKENHAQSTCVVVGSLICTAGAGDSIYSPDTILCFDTAVPSSAWKKYKMTTPRQFPLMAAMEGKVHIIGGTDDHLRFGEIFDPYTGNKIDVTSPGRFPPQSFAVIAAHPNDKRIMLLSCWSDSLFCYNLSENQGWKELPNPPSDEWSFWIRQIRSHNFAVADTTIYWFSQRFPEIFAFDFVANEFSQSDKVEEYEREWKRYYQRPPIVLHISGELFYLVWSVPVLDNPLSDNAHFVKVRITKCNDKEPLRVSVVSTRTYLLKNKDDLLFINAVLVNLKT